MMEQELNKKDFFISYNHKDEDAARWISWQLEKEGYTTIIQAWDFLPGNNFVEKMDNALKACKSTIAVLSDHYLQSGFTKAEWQAAFAKDPTGEKRSLIPVRIQSCDLEGLLGQIIYIDLVGLKEEEARKKLLESIRSTRLKPAEPPPFKGFETQPVTRLNRNEILKKRHTELKEILKKIIKHNYHMALKLEEEIEKEIEIEDEKTGEIEKRKELVWEEVELEKILANKNNYILINPSGMGKTTFLTYIAYALLDSNKYYEIFPFLTTCIELNKRQSTIYDFIKSNLESFYYNPQTSLIYNEWENVCILIDALDQARDVDDIASSLHLQNKYSNYKKAKIIISSRQNTAGKIKEGFNKIRLKLPGDDEVQHYLGEKHYSNLESLIDSSRELVTVPVLLEMLKIIAEKGHISSKIYNRSTLYNEFTRILIDQERNKPRYWQNPSFINNFINYELEKSLEKIAFFPLANNEILEIGKDKLLKYCESPEKKESLLNIGIILELFEDRELKLVFRHQSFQAYFAARYIYYQAPEYFKQLTNDLAFFYSDVWYEVLRFYIGFEKDPQKAEAIINSIYQKKYKKDDLNYSLRLIFAFFLMSETRVSNEKVDELYEQLRNLLNNNKGSFEFIKINIDKFNISNTDQRERIYIILDPLLCADDRLVRGAAAEALRKIDASKEIQRLELLLKDDDIFTRVGAVMALLTSTKDIPLLEHLLRDDVPVFRIVAAEALGEIGYSKHIHLLKPLISDEYHGVRSAAAESIGRIGSSKEIHLLEPLLRDNDKNVKIAATEALGKIGTSKEIPLVEPLLGEYDINVQIAAAKALVNIVTSKDIPLLEPMLRDENDHVRSAAARALGKIGTSKEILLLEPMLKDDNNHVRIAAATALGKIGTSKEIPLLEPLLKDYDWVVRGYAVEALGKIGTSKEIPILESLFRDDSRFVREAAARALCNIGTSKDIPLIEPLLREYDVNVRSAAAEALVKIVTSKDTPLLKPLLRDDNKNVKIAAAEALGKIGTSKDIPLLAPLLRDYRWKVQYAAVGVLGKIGTSKEIPLLAPLLRGYDVSVQIAAVRAFGKIGTSNDIPLLEPRLKYDNINARIAAAEAIENIYKRLNPKLKIIETISRAGEKGIIKKYKYGTSKRINILHISDIHYSEKNNPDIKLIFHEFLEDLEKWQRQNPKEKINIICLTGDIAGSGELTQYRSIEKRIRDILGVTGCTKDDLFIVPGNHDVEKYDKISVKNKETLAGILDNKIDINSQILNSHKNYEDSLNKFDNFYTFLKDYGYNNSKIERDDQSPKPWYSRKLKDSPIRIIGLNSALFSCKAFNEYGKISMGTRQLKEAYFKDNTGDDEQIIMLSHHPINWLCEKEFEEFSTLMERYSIIHLHGHTHKIKPRKLFSFSGSYFTIGTGSLYGKKGINEINTYHILTLDFEKDEITIWARRWIPEQMMWALYSDEINNKFPFPRRIRKAS